MTRGLTWRFMLLLALGAPALPVSAQDVAAKPDVARALERARIAVAARASAWVVRLEVTRDATKAPKTPTSPRRPGRRPQTGPYYRRPEGPVSGVVIAAEGLILTSNFNVSDEGGPVTGITVTLPDGRERPGRIVGRDEVQDVALVQVEGVSGLAVPERLSRAEMQALPIGAFVAVVGRSLNPLEVSMTTGILSARERRGLGTLQFDAKTNYGNTGGALVDLRGRLIGIVTFVAPRERGGQNSGVSFATSLAHIGDVLEDLKAGKVIKKPKFGYLGVQLGQENPGQEGAMIAQVQPNTGAAAAGLKDHDVITGVNGKPVRNNNDLIRAIRGRTPGETLKLEVLRDGQTLTLEATLGERP